MAIIPERKAPKPSEFATGNYRNFRIPLTNARTTELVWQEPGDFIAVVKIQGTGAVTIFLDSKNADPIDLRILRRIRTRFKKIYLSNDASSGSELSLQIGGAASFEVDTTISSEVEIRDPTNTNQKLAVDSAGAGLVRLKDNTFNTESTTPPADGGTVTGTSRDSLGFNEFGARVFADQPGTMKIQSSIDNVTYRQIDSKAVAANTVVEAVYAVQVRYYRAVYTDTSDAAAPTIFELTTMQRPIGG